MKKIIFLLVFLYSNLLFADLPTGGIIYNSTTEADVKIALGVNPQGHLGYSAGNIANNASVTGIAYKFQIGDISTHGDNDPLTSTQWYDATSPGCQCEGWSAGGTDSRGRTFHGDASIDNGGIENIEVKSFVVDETSMESVVWIKDTSGNYVLEVKHVYSPAPIATDRLFEVLVTMTNISGSTIQNVRYNRTMDWDIPPTEFSEIVTIVGVDDSKASASKPRVHRSGNNGFRDPDVHSGWSWHWGGSAYTRSGAPMTSDMNRYGPHDHGFTVTFEFDELLCGEAHSFKTYYGAAGTRELMIDAFDDESVPLYSLGEHNDTTASTVTYGYGFKGVSGTALAPTLPEKTAILPGGIETDETKVQTYANPVISDSGYAYQAVFKFRNDHQWEGDILRYELDEDGNFKDKATFPPVSAATLLEAKINNSNYDTSDYFDDGRGVWTVGYDPNCITSPFLTRASKTVTLPAGVPGGGTSKTILDQNNFRSGTDDELEKLIYNCGNEPSSNDTKNLVKFIRGFDSYNEDTVSGDSSNLRKSLLGDTFHSELVYVGAPVGSLSSANPKTEAYFRNANDYAAFKELHKDRADRLYVGANDGMLHAFDKDLNLLWSFVPPSVLPKLRGLVGESGKSNTKWLIDGPIMVKDVYISATSEWKTVLVGALGWGGKGYYVLDITDAWNPKHMFTIDNDDKNKQVSYWNESGYKRTFDYAAAPDNLDYSGLGDTWARPSIFLLPYDGGVGVSQRYVMAFGAGYAGGLATGLGNWLYVLDFEPSSATYSDPVTGTTMPETSGGNVIKKIAIAADSTSDIPNGVTANMSVVTADGASTADFFGGIAYFPDLTGQMWKLDMSKTNLAELNTSMWTLTKAFRAEGTLDNDRYGYNQMATTLVKSTDPAGTHIFSYFGTGDQAHIQRRDLTIQNRIYGVKDFDFPGVDLTETGEAKTITSAGILSINGTASCSFENVPGWWANVSEKTTLITDSSGDFTKVVGRALIAKGDVYFTLYRPENNSCPLGGTGEVIKMLSGCSGGTVSIATGAGLSTAPVMDSSGNIYVGVSNLATEGELDITATESDERSGVDNILKIGTADISSGGDAAGINIKSWRELRRED